jgi:hypothetical protein
LTLPEFVGQVQLDNGLEGLVLWNPVVVARVVALVV